MPLPGQFCLSGIVRGSWSDMFWLYPLGSCLSNSVFMHCGVSFAFLTAAMAGPDACFSWNWCALSEPAWRCAVHVRKLKPVAICFSLIFFFFSNFSVFSGSRYFCKFFAMYRLPVLPFFEEKIIFLTGESSADSSAVYRLPVCAIFFEKYFSWLENSPLLVQSCVQRTAVTLRLL